MINKKIFANKDYINYKTYIFLIKNNNKKLLL